MTDGHESPFQQVTRFFNRWRRDRRGNVALIFGLAAIPLFVGAGAAIDTSRAYIVQSRLTQALDAAGLAVGSMIGLTPAEMQARAEDFFAANYPVDEIGVPAKPVVAVVGDVVTLSATAELPTAIMGVIGINKLNVNASVEITRESKGLELVMVLDNTGSMRNDGKIDALKTASNDLIDILFGDDPFPTKVKVGMVPFAASVNVGTAFRASGNMDLNAQSSIHSENFTAGINLWDLYDELDDRAWNGCVQTRPEPLDENDTTPTLANPDTLWVPWFAPDEPNLSGYNNSYLSDGISGDAETRQRDTTKYTDATVGSTSKGPDGGSTSDYRCTLKPITPLTNDRDLLFDKIDEMTANGYTHIPVGLAWGWRVVSPTQPFTEGTTYTDEDVNKAVILLTDGMNTMPGANNHNESQYTGYGYVAEGRLGTTDNDEAESRLDPKTARICENIKAIKRADGEDAIRVYTVTFKLNDVPTQNMMRACATEPRLYFDSPTNEQLRLVFQNIAQDLSNLRLSR